MNQLPYHDALRMLRRAGFAEAEIVRLSQLRRDYRMCELDQSPLDLKRLQFVRWLVVTGRLTDYSSKSETSSETPEPPSSMGWPRMKNFFDRLRGCTDTPT